MTNIKIQSIPVNAKPRKLNVTWKSEPIEIYKINGQYYMDPQTNEDMIWKNQNTKTNWLFGKSYPFRNRV